MSVRQVLGNAVGLLLAERSAGPLAAAAALGMFLGIAPLVSLQSLVVLAAVLFLRVNLAATLAAAGGFGLAALALAQAFDGLGVALLRAGSLGGFWTWIYHSPLSWLRTHEATALGGSLVAVVLAMPVWLATRWAARRFQAAPAVPDAPAPRRRWLRRGALLPMTVVFLALLGGVGLARDGLLRAAAVAGLESAFGARAEVADLDTTLTPTVALAHVAVADRRDPMRNAFEFDRFAGGLALGPLLAGRLEIPELTLEGLRFGTPRAESGALPDAGAEPEPAVDRASAGPTFEQALDDLLSMLSPPALESLEAVREARALEAEARERLAAIEGRVRASTLPRRLEDAKTAVAAIAAVAPPASFRAVEQAARELAALRPDSAAIEAIRADLAAAVPDFDRERKAIAAARADLTAVAGAAERAQALVKRASEIRKFSLQDALKIAGLLKDLESTQRGLGGATTKLGNASSALTAARDGIERRMREAEARLRTGRERLASAQALLDRAATELPERAGALGAAIENARTDLAAAHGQAQARLARAREDLAAAQAEAQALRQELADGVALATGAPARLAAALERDRTELAARYSMDRFSVEQLLGPLLGDEAVEWLRWTLTTWDRLQPLLAPSGEAAGPRSVRLDAGTVFTFPGDAATPPVFFVGKLAFTGTLELSGHPFQLAGRAENLSTNLAAAGSDLLVEFQATHRERTLRATIRVTRAGEASFKFEADGIPISGRLASHRLRAGIDEGRVDLAIEGGIGPGRVRAAARCTLDGLKLTLADDALDPRLGFLRQALAALTRIEADVALRFADGRFESFTARAAGGAEFAERVRAALVDQVTAARDEAFGRIEAQAAGPRREAETAAAGIARQAGPPVEALLGTVAGDLRAIDAAGTEALGRFAEMAGLLDAGADPGAALEETRATLAALATTSAGLDGAAALVAADPLAAADGARAVSDQAKAALAAAESAVKSELARLAGLR